MFPVVKDEGSLGLKKAKIEYIQAMARELGLMAKTEQLDFAAYMMSVVYMELGERLVADQRRNHKTARPSLRLAANELRKMGK
ncbi:hypothetical protein [Mesorhizobium retamae]|uniref:Uncharacterized protein n=1 Tax=Mesorhizobium retamae TaxID=2912854 RepID=A0ABS9QPD8_9HYPH|nr:hypothetical protein [Mesorhizobium sp. IRAMC:0171]MCG7509317.1 hypothetical protein [Mesorhizobium sp. IRAMC:0171]